MTCPSGLLSFLCWRNFPPLIRREAQLEKEYNVGGFFFPITAGKKKKSPKKCAWACCTSCKSPAGQSSDLRFNIKKLNETGRSRNAKPSLQTSAFKMFVAVLQVQYRSVHVWAWQE